MPKTFVISLGGSLIFPKSLDAKFLTSFKKRIGSHAKKSCRFAIVCGGGRLARNFQKSASKRKRLSNKELDWLGIYATRINAHIVRAIFGNMASDSIVSNPTEKLRFEKNIMIAAGWKPGWSTDYVAVLLAKNLGIKEVINMSNVDYVYDKDPRKHKNARRIGKIDWRGYSRLISGRWEAGMNAPFDPVAAKEAQKSGIKVNIIGRDLKNLENLLNGKKFRGTIIQ